MKFSQELHRHQVPLWADNYLDYNGLKRLVKRARPRVGEHCGGVIDFIGILENIGQEIDTVQTFYNKTYETIWDEVAKFYMSLDFLERKDWNGIDHHELRYFLGTFLQSRAALKKLQWYGKVNEYGFKRLLQKLDQSGPEIINAALLSEIQSKLSNAQFSSQTASLYDLQCIQSSIAAITRILSEDQPVSNRSLILDHFVSQWHSSLHNSDLAYEAIRNDNAASLNQFFKDNVDMTETEKWRNQLLILVLIQLSITCESRMCINKLTLLMESIHEDDFTAKDYLPLVIIRIIVKMGHDKMLASFQVQKLPHIQGSGDLTQNGDNSLSLLSYILTGLDANTQAALLTPDPFFKRLPLQYAAHYGFSEVCLLLIEHMRAFQLGDLPASEAVVSPDYLGNSPLKLAVICGHSTATQILLEFYTRGKSSEKCIGKGGWEEISGHLLADALRTNPETLKYLLAAGANINYYGEHGETALYIAARSGDEESVKLLLSYNADLDPIETDKGQTPLLIASLEGHLAIVALLLEAGASQEKRDSSGWTALDRAASGGYITVAKKLEEFFKGDLAATTKISSNGMAHSATPVRMPIDESRILVNLAGSLRSTGDMIALDLGPYLSMENSTIESETGFSLEISLVGAGATSYSMELPILADMTNKPWSFPAKDPSKAKIMFKVRRKVAPTKKSSDWVLIGTGIALLGSLTRGLGPTRESLIREHTIPILAKDSLEDIGTITFSFLIVKSFEQLKINAPARNKLWKDGGPTKVVGHRGSGMNIGGQKKLQIGENTITSFLKAADLGAAWVELDVQLTKDHFPVIYHDFLVDETGTDIWMHQLSLEQLKHISDAQLQPLQRPSEVYAGVKKRSNSLNIADNDYRITDLAKRMEPTLVYKKKGFKGNTRGHYIHEPFITLADLLSKTPATLPLNIEIKYPMLSELVSEFASPPYAIEINLFLDTILRTILSHHSTATRPILFSSFSPEICILASLKQTTYPIFFLSDSGTNPHTTDSRAQSLREAVRFARRWELDGVVMNNVPFVMAPKLVAEVKNKGLVTASYGGLNNDPVCAKIQADAGLDIIIVDNVRLISETLNGKK